MTSRPLRVGVSMCLLGENVRFDGGHKRHPLLVETVGRFVEWVPVCPEVEAGLGTPREPMRLVRERGEIRVVTVNTGIDLTATLREFARSKVEALVGLHLSGFVLKKASPSCGVEGVETIDATGAPSRPGQGVFAEALVARFPGMPVEEEDRLSDARFCEQFIERVRSYWRTSGSDQ